MKLTFNADEKLKRKSDIAFLFKTGKAIKAYPLKMLYVKSTVYNTPLKVAVTVPKKNVKKAVHRNRIKRLLREAYRLNKPIVYNQLQQNYMLIILYLGKDLPDFKTINTQTKHLLKQLKINDETI